MSDKPKSRNFLRPLTFAVAAVLATAGTDASTSVNIHTTIEKANQITVEQRLEKAQPAPLVIEPAEQMNTNMLAAHRSHYSHRSHSSHRSHYSGY